METEIVLLRRTRLFIAANSGYPVADLMKAGNILAKGTKVSIGNPEYRKWNNREHLVVPVKFGRQPHFLIVSDIGNLNQRRVN